MGLTILSGPPRDGGSAFSLPSTTTSTLAVNCLAWTGSGSVRLQCGDEATSGFTIGLSTDSGGGFAPAPSGDVTASCPSNTSAGSCSALWCATANAIGASCRPSGRGSGRRRRRPYCGAAAAGAVVRWAAVHDRQRTFCWRSRWCCSSSRSGHPARSGDRQPLRGRCEHLPMTSDTRQLPKNERARSVPGPNILDCMSRARVSSWRSRKSEPGRRIAGPCWSHCGQPHLHASADRATAVLDVEARPEAAVWMERAPSFVG